MFATPKTEISNKNLKNTHANSKVLADHYRKIN